jgi:AcrR family transcriptional regulator
MADGRTAAVTTGRRAARKAQTRRLLAESALTLFAESGYDETTVAQITARVGVTERAFFLHFSSKADALFDLSTEDLDAFRARVLAAPPAESDVMALERACIAWQLARGDLDHQHEMARLLLKAVSSSPTLRGKQFDYNEMLVNAAAAALAERHGLAAPTLPMRMVAVVVMRVLHASYLTWAASGRPRQFETLAERHFKAMHNAVSPDGPALSEGYA